jgi:hypothetical protein
MSLTYQRSRITGAGLVAAQYDLTLERQTIMDNILFIPGIANPVSEINQLLFGQGQQGTFIAPSLTASLISGSTFGTGVQTLPDLSPRNNPFSQANSGNRAAWFREPKTGRRNSLTRTEEVDNAAWTKTNITVTQNTTIAPDGTLTADTITPTTAAENIVFSGTQGTAGSNTATFSLHIKKTAGWAVLLIWNGTGNQGIRQWVNCSTGVLGTGSTNTTGTLLGAATQDLGDYFRVSVSGTISGFFRVAFRIVDGDNDFLYTGVNLTPIVAWGAQLELGSTATPYQRVTTAFDVTEAGQRDCFGVRFDGTDDWYERAINFSGTDKVTLFVAMRRRSDAARGTVLELTSSIDSNNGAFHLTAPNAASATFGFESKGTTLRDAVITQAMGNPRIITAIGDISGDLASIQVDNGTPTTNTGDQGSGNYANSTLYLGRRGGSSLSLNGDIFAVIAAGDDYTSATRQRVRTILSRITPTVNL